MDKGDFNWDKTSIDFNLKMYIMFKNKNVFYNKGVVQAAPPPIPSCDKKPPFFIFLDPSLMQNIYFVQTGDWFEILMRFS